MSDSSRLFFTGSTLEQAVLAAARHFEIEPDAVDYEKIERKAGLLSGKRKIVIRVDADSPARGVVDGNATADEPAPESTPQPETQSDFQLDTPTENTPAVPEPAAPQSSLAPPREERRSVAAAMAEEDDDDETDDETDDENSQEHSSEPEKAREARQPRRPRPNREDHTEPRTEPRIEDMPEATGPQAEAVLKGVSLLARMADLKLTARVHQGEEQLYVEVFGEDQGDLVEGEGRLLLAFQHLLPRMLQGLTGEMVPCKVDSDGFRRKRIASLERMALEVADEVREAGRSKTLKSMNPADRRTIHLALQEEEDVVTESEGRGFFKRVTVRPA